ncbi:MAG: glycosyltransferase [Deltaproteobacteria bacterium]|nr:glycosyltransferase [Deltaproteobacteria bacterium]
MFIIISALLGRRTLLQLRGSNFLNWLNSASGLTKVYVAKVLRQARGVIVLGDSLKYQFSSFFSKDKIFAVPNGADFKTPASIEKVKSAGVLKLLCLSNLQPSKGVEDVIQGVLILKRFHGESKVELNIVGSWRGDTTKNTCTNLVKEFDLPVFFQSSTAGEEKFAYYLKADIFVFTPREPEGHPWVIVEAMAAGLPIITTDQGAITEAVFDGVNGFIVGMQKPEQIAHKIRILAEDIPLRKKMGRASRRLYEECFTETKMVQNLRECFCEIING